MFLCMFFYACFHLTTLRFLISEQIFCDLHVGQVVEKHLVIAMDAQDMTPIDMQAPMYVISRPRLDCLGMKCRSVNLLSQVADFEKSSCPTFHIRRLPSQPRRGHCQRVCECKQFNLENIQRSRLAKLGVSTNTLTSIYTVRQAEYALD